MAGQRLQLLKKRLLKDEDFLTKYRTTIQEYIAKGHAQKVPKEELNFKKTTKVRAVFNCAAKYCGISLNQQLLQGPDLTNLPVGVMIRFRQEPVAIAADIEAVPPSLC